MLKRLEVLDLFDVEGDADFRFVEGAKHLVDVEVVLEHCKDRGGSSGSACDSLEVSWMRRKAAACEHAGHLIECVLEILWVFADGDECAHQSVKVDALRCKRPLHVLGDLSLLFDALSPTRDELANRLHGLRKRLWWAGAWCSLTPGLHDWSGFWRLGHGTEEMNAPEIASDRLFQVALGDAEPPRDPTSQNGDRADPPQTPCDGPRLTTLGAVHELDSVAFLCDAKVDEGYIHFGACGGVHLGFCGERIRFVRVWR